jgi:hypothetical protein
MRFKRSQTSIVDGDDSIGIIICARGRSKLSQRGREIELRAGDAVAILHSEPSTITYVEGLLFYLAVSREALTQRVTNVDSLTMRRISHRTEERFWFLLPSHSLSDAPRRERNRRSTANRFRFTPMSRQSAGDGGFSHRPGLLQEAPWPRA